MADRCRDTRLSESDSVIDLNLFAGAGGLTIGLKAAEFNPTLLYESDPHAWSTLTENSIAF